MLDLVRRAIVCVLALVVWKSALIAVVNPSCDARLSIVGQETIQWVPGPADDRKHLDDWCRAVGPPVVVPRLDRRESPARLDELVVIGWNVHLSEGRLADLVSDLRAGRLTDGRPLQGFVLLLQELFRRGPEVPVMTDGARSAIGIVARDPDAPDVLAHARRLGLATVYVPSMRNGVNLNEDRGNAIISTESLVDLRAIELPFERQRRVAIGAHVVVQADGRLQRLALMNVHLEPLSKPSSLWFFHNPRRRQVAAVLALLQPPSATASVGTVLGGDFNTVQGGTQEEAYRLARAWSRGLEQEDPRSTHDLGRLDFLFAQVRPEWRVTTQRIENKYGSDHHPVMARFRSTRTGQ